MSVDRFIHRFVSENIYSLLSFFFSNSHIIIFNSIPNLDSSSYSLTLSTESLSSLSYAFHECSQKPQRAIIHSFGNCTQTYFDQSNKRLCLFFCMNGTRHNSYSPKMNKLAQLSSDCVLLIVKYIQIIFLSWQLNVFIFIL